MVLIGYRGGSSSGVSLTVTTETAEEIEWHDVFVSNERLEKSVMKVGEWQSYKATVVDDAGNALPEWFCVRLVAVDSSGNKIKLSEVCFAPDVYNPSTKEVAIAFQAPQEVGTYTVRLEWDDQTQP